MDEHAHRWANKLLENDQNCACIEVLMGQFEAEFDSRTTIAVTGADLGLRLNGSPVDNWQTIPIKNGDRISLDQSVNGLRAYIGVVGGWQTPVRFCSRSTVLREGLGGIDGAGLKTGQALAYTNSSIPVPMRTLSQSKRPDYTAELKLKLVPGYQFDHFSSFAKRRFFNNEYCVSQQIDRMGYRLEGPSIKASQQSLISEGIAYGAIQVPPDGQPIVLMRDRQTIGGYPKIGCLSSLDSSRLSQRVPGSRLTFELSDVASSQTERQLFDRLLEAGRWTESGNALLWP